MATNKISEMSVKELKQIAIECQSALDDDCFGVSDCVNLELALRELERRGYEINEDKRTTLTFKKV